MQYRADAEPTPAAPPPATPLEPAASDAEPPARSAPANLVTLEQTVLGEVGADKRDLFVNSLFNRSIEAYERVLRQLYATPNWSEATRIITDDVFRAFEVDIWSDPAIMFTDTVEARYLERKT